MAASIEPPAFAIVVSGGGLAPREVELASYRAKVIETDDSVDARRNSEIVLGAYFDYLDGQISREILDGIFQRFRDQPWFAALGLERIVPSETNRHNWQWVSSFDPADSIRAQQIPVLVLLGGKDPLTPLAPTRQAWEAALNPGVVESSVVIFPNAGHGIRQGPHHGPFADGFFQRQLDWLKMLGILGASDEEP